jgi:hypothetical protein
MEIRARICLSDYNKINKLYFSYFSIRPQVIKPKTYIYVHKMRG